MDIKENDAHGTLSYLCIEFPVARLRRVDFSGGRSELIRGGPLWGSCVVALSVGGPSSAPPPVAAGGGVFCFQNGP